MWEKQIPHLGIGFNQGPEKSSQGLISDLDLPICLRVASGAILELGSHFLPQDNPKVTQELGDTVPEYGPWNTM